MLRETREKAVGGINSNNAEVAKAALFYLPPLLQCLRSTFLQQRLQERMISLSDLWRGF
jgi:hypothetical protein